MSNSNSGFFNQSKLGRPVLDTHVKTPILFYSNVFNEANAKKLTHGGDMNGLPPHPVPSVRFQTGPRTREAVLRLKAHEELETLPAADAQHWGGRVLGKRTPCFKFERSMRVNHVHDVHGDQHRN